MKLMDVIVIGCGASGIAVLRRLHDAGLTALGLEAAGRIGGRINTVPFADNVVDLGGAWCHGEKDNIVYEIANPLDLLGRPDPDKIWYLLSNGSFAPDILIKDMVQAVADSVSEAAKDDITSIAECVVKAAESKEIFKNSDLTRPLIEWYGRINHLGGEDDPKNGKSLRGLTENWVCEGEPTLNWKGRGYKTILDVLLNRHPDPAKEIPVEILLNKEVDSIRWGTIQFGKDSTKSLVHVTCKDGSLFMANSVIITIPLGVLKERHHHLFKPSLPANKITAINNLDFCILDKIYVEFTEAWWSKAPAQFNILWREEDKQKFSEMKWVTSIFGANTVADQPNVLLFWIYGNGAKDMEEASQEDVEKGVEQLLTMFMTNFDITPIKAVLRSQWATNPLARGAYSYRSVRTEEHGGSALDLSEPLYQNDEFPVVCFAGEATSHHRHNSVHGAIEAGFREADRLIDCFKKLKEKSS
ncbi:unnamed protein product [Diatraea saccharalis]|uniref:Amine oxidase domain-containing protein n=1 Tax=Diatraea saccharalis TaxID=40085 RepID=A0A9P0C920_9NEOP|nr:unnamed protein product [Diatraea saccharalis]